MPDLPPHPSLEYLRKQAKTRKRERGIGLSQAQHELGREYGFASWPQLVRHVQSTSLEGIERALVLADTRAPARLLHTDPTAATVTVDGLAPLLVLLRRSIGPPADVRTCAGLLLDAGADPDSHTVEWGGEGRMSALPSVPSHWVLAITEPAPCARNDAAHAYRKATGKAEQEEDAACGLQSGAESL